MLTMCSLIFLNLLQSFNFKLIDYNFINFMLFSITMYQNFTEGMPHPEIQSTLSHIYTVRAMSQLKVCLVWLA